VKYIHLPFISWAELINYKLIQCVQHFKNQLTQTMLKK